MAISKSELIQAAESQSAITHTKTGNLYFLLGLGKVKNEDGSWTEVITYTGLDNVYYSRPYHLFTGFEIFSK